MLLQGVENFYETDQVRPVLDAASKLSGKKYHGSESAEDEGYEDDVRMRVVADHIRSSLMLIADGVTPSNEGSRLHSAPSDAPCYPCDASAGRY